MPGSTKWRPAAGVVIQEDAGEGFLLHLESGQYYTLNRTGLLVWKALDAGEDPVAAVRSRYSGVAAASVEADVDGVIAELAAAGLVVGD